MNYCIKYSFGVGLAAVPQYTPIMVKKKKSKRFRAVTAVKEMARERIGTPPPTQVVPDRTKRKKEKHKPTLGKLLGDL